MLKAADLGQRWMRGVSGELALKRGNAGHPHSQVIFLVLNGSVLDKQALDEQTNIRSNSRFLHSLCGSSHCRASGVGRVSEEF